MRQLAIVVVLALLMAAPSPRAQEPPNAASSDSSVEAEAPRETEAASTAVPDIEVAYHAYAGGDLAAADRILSLLIERQPSPAAYLLRGCTRYTVAMLAKDRGQLIPYAREDVRQAFALNPSLWLDPAVFSPRLRAFLEQVRREGN